MSKIFKIVRPKSLNDSNYEAFEYLLRWIGRDGSEYLYMFYDAELALKVSNEVINEQDSSKLQSLVSKIGRSVTLQAEDLSLNDYQIISQILEQKFVTRIFKDGSIERYAPDSNSLKYRLRNGRYNIEFDLVQSDIKAWR